MNMTIQTRFGLGLMQKAAYPNGRLALRLIDYDDGSPIAVLTTNIPSAKLEPGEFLVKTWSENETIAEACLASGFFVDTGKRVKTGFTEAHIWRFSDEYRIED